MLFRADRHCPVDAESRNDFMRSSVFKVLQVAANHEPYTEVTLQVMCFDILSLAPHAAGIAEKNHMEILVKTEEVVDIREENPISTAVVIKTVHASRRLRNSTKIKSTQGVESAKPERPLIGEFITGIAAGSPDRDEVAVWYPAGVDSVTEKACVLGQRVSPAVV